MPQNTDWATDGGSVRTLPSNIATDKPARCGVCGMLGSTCSGRGRTWKVFPGIDGRVVAVAGSVTGSTSCQPRSANVARRLP
jgi:hypothetical protein